MSNTFPVRPQPVPDAWRFVIVASEYNADYVDGLVRFATNELAAIAPQGTIAVHRVPGSFEIPLAVRRLAAGKTADAILTFGLIFDGETLHADLIASAVTRALLDLSLGYDLPILHEVLVVKTEQQAQARCLEPAMNRGTEAARAAVRVLSALSAI